MRVGDTSLGGNGRMFPETVGALIGRVSDSSAADREKALAEFCNSYWKPVYTYLRAAWAKSNEDAKDLVQAFFLWIWETNPLERYTRERGRFRSYLKSLLKHFVQHQDEALSRLKRGGHLRFVPIDASEQSSLEISDPKSSDPDRAFDETWRNQLLERAIERVSRQYKDSGRELRFRVFQEYDAAPAEARPTYGALAERLGIKATDVHNYLVAIREDIRSELRSELARHTNGPEELEEEWRDFFSKS